QDAAFAAEFNADVSREKIAEVYAEALAGACDAVQADFDSVLEEFASLFADVFAAWPKLEEIFNSAMVSAGEKSRILDEILGSSSEMFRNFLKTVNRRGRLDLLRDMYRQCAVLSRRRHGHVAVQITTAAPLDEAVRESLVAQLRKLVKGEPDITAVVDPETIGGIIVRVGDTLFDASIATQLKNVRQQMIDRSAHEIQSRRNSFSNTEGN
ncbi:MAG: ATP synthase F1 subunit delta, partial [Thermoguttaceae bacterium]|nr:ATP synthase F1 subunit delta [Thermoguttaceae bacterium]